MALRASSSPGVASSVVTLALVSRSGLSHSIGSTIPVRRHAIGGAPIFEGKPTVLVAEKLEETGLNLLRKHAHVDYSYDLTHEELCAKISLCDALVVNSSTKVTRDVFALSDGRLKVVARVGVGIDNIDLSAATEHGCVVVDAPTASTISAAEHGIALLTAMARNIAQADASVKLGNWDRSRFVGVSLTGKTMAILGLGKVGSEVSRRAKSLGMHVIAYDPFAPGERARAIGVELVTFDEALSTSDFVSIHMPLTQDTAKLLNDDAFSRMKKGVRIINVARGAIIDEDSLLRALESGIVSQAALDVLVDEPPPTTCKLVQHEKVIVTPHLAASNSEFQEDASIEIAEAVLRALKGELESTVVNAPSVPNKVASELAPFRSLAEKLGMLAGQLVANGSCVRSMKVTYASARDPKDLDTQLLRGMIMKGFIEAISSVIINLINVDFFATKMGIELREEIIASAGSPAKPVEFIQIQIEDVETQFHIAISDAGNLELQGRVADGLPRLTKVGSCDCDVSIEGSLILCRQTDQPGIIGRVGNYLGDENININHMNLRRITPEKLALMAIGVEKQPSLETLKQIQEIPAIEELVFLKL